MHTKDAALSAEEIRRRAADYEWYHAVDLGHGIVTPGQYDLTPLLPNYGIPDSLAGKSVLDVGPGHGFFAFEFERRGAKVTTSELPTWTAHDGGPVLRETFSRIPEEAGTEYHRGAFGFAIQARGSQVVRRFESVYDLTPERTGRFDLVFCASVLLHLTDPLRALYAIRGVCRDEAIICTGIDTQLHVTNQARARFVGTASNQAFWLPTMTCLEQWVLAAGFARVERISTFRLHSVDGKFDTPHGAVRGLVA